MQYMTALTGVVFSIAQAITVRTGHLLGERNRDSAKRTAWLGVAISAMFMIIVALFYIMTPQLLISVDLDITNPANKQLIWIIKQLFLAAAAFQIMEAIRIALFGALRGYKDTRFSLYISILGFWVIALPAGYLFTFVYQFNASGLWWGMTLGVSISAVLMFWRFKTIEFS